MSRSHSLPNRILLTLLQLIRSKNDFSILYELPKSIHKLYLLAFRDDDLGVHESANALQSVALRMELINQFLQSLVRSLQLADSAALRLLRSNLTANRLRPHFHAVIEALHARYSALKTTERRNIHPENGIKLFRCLRSANLIGQHKISYESLVDARTQGFSGSRQS